MSIDSTLSPVSAWGHQAAHQLVPLAKELDENKVTPGVLGFVVFALLGGAVWLLMKNMNRQFTKIDFEEKGAGAGEGGAPEAAERGATVPPARAAGPADDSAGGAAGADRTGGDRPVPGSGA
ncbi:hypothetical protein [Streptomyces zingiberis]|uniref:Uncharacterized protein n=1 Tax=Streptomyces zingiberis TaxID=2053010 RepID=A0ABX1BTY8_9ACTN|nr:hypothetical protein [Streptomyces zingiberis]NJQ00548.1 hypothetical protein [Streptomyces zingiberis]